ncbi:MAG: GntR family transcriptional regulator [Firmicutes bacterium]|nr:GntR family transcriptional regulator [Bacillota bacterium]
MAEFDYYLPEETAKLSPQELAKHQIAVDIITGEIRPGQRLIESKLCERFGLSRPPLREIINQLAGEGFVDLIPNRGAFAVSFDARQLSDILFLRNLLFPQAVQWAIERITSDEFEELMETFNFISFYTPTGDINKLRRFTVAFDHMIYKASKEPEIRRSLEKYDLIIRNAFDGVAMPLNYAESLLSEYKAMYDAFVTRNPSMGE